MDNRCVSPKVDLPALPVCQGRIAGDLHRHRGIILETEARSTCAVIRVQVPLANLFGYATVVRGLSKGMATFSMEISHYAQVPVRLAEEIIAQRRAKQAARK